MILFSKDKHILIWFENLLKNDIIRESVERYHVHKSKLYIFFKEDLVKAAPGYPGVNSVVIEFVLTWRRKIKSVDRVQLCDSWEDKFGHGVITTMSDHVYGYCALDTDYVTELILPYLQDERWKRNTKFGL